MTILIIEDSPFIRLATERALTKAGHQVICAADGEEGLRFAQEQVPDLIVLDMMLPKLTGTSVLKALRGYPQTAAIPVMVLTSLPKSNETKLLRDGATSVCEKSELMLHKNSDAFIGKVEKMLD